MNMTGNYFPKSSFLGEPSWGGGHNFDPNSQWFSDPINPVLIPCGGQVKKSQPEVLAEFGVSRMRGWGEPSAASGTTPVHVAATSSRGLMVHRWGTPQTMNWTTFPQFMPTPIWDTELVQHGKRYQKLDNQKQARSFLGITDSWFVLQFGSVVKSPHVLSLKQAMDKIVWTVW